MDMLLGSAHVTLPVWVLAAATAFATAGAVGGAYVLGRAQPTTRFRRWLSRGVALVLLLFTFELTALFSHAFVFATDPRLRGYPVNICFGDPHWNMLIGAFLPPVAAVAAFVLTRRSRKRRITVVTSPPVITASGA